MKKRKKTKKAIPAPSAEERELHEGTQRMLAERIAYHEARIAAREHGDDSRAATA